VTDDLIQQVIAYVCVFCPRKKRFAQRGTAIKHAQRCFYNPERRACITCKHFSFEPAERPDWSTGYPGSPAGYGCEFGLIPIKKGPEEPEQVMTADCEKWEQKSEVEPLWTTKRK